MIVRFLERPGNAVTLLQILRDFLPGLLPLHRKLFGSLPKTICERGTRGDRSGKRDERRSRASWKVRVAAENSQTADRFGLPAAVGWRFILHTA